MPRPAAAAVIVLVALAVTSFSRSRYYLQPYSDRLGLIRGDDTVIDNSLYDEAQWYENGTIWRTLEMMNTVRAPFFHRHLSRGGKVPSNGRYLDVGCGGGLLTEEMASTYGYNITGIDISEASLQQARHHGRHLPNLHYQVGSAYEIPFPDNSFDGVIISDVLEHLLDLRAALSEIHRVLKPGGVLVFDTISRTLWSYTTVWLITQEILNIMPPNAHDWRLFVTPTELGAALANAGFSIVTDDEAAWAGLVLKSPVKG
ncbi:Hexaprenyldihydroxybenzoate methyltransferase, mitochondrial, partial [Perkinsus olseni]